MIKREKVREVLLENNGSPELVRVLLKFWLPFRKYPGNGVWSYILKTNDGVVVFDVGAEKGFWIKRTKNVKVVIEAVKEYFPGKSIREITLSHYHYDHAGGAPLLQKRAEEEWGYKPKIRIHEKDGEVKKFMKIQKSTLVKLFEKSGVKDWTLGEWLCDGETLGNSNWIVKHTPGHTSGAVSLINEKEKILIGGWLNEEIENRLVRWAQNKIIDEDSASYIKTKMEIDSLKGLGYSRYYLHPMIKKASRSRIRI